MYTLFISTYNENIIIGLLNDGKKINEIIKESYQSHSILLVPMIEEILKSNKITVKDLKEIIVVNGPGSFTGVRLGVTVAKTLAYTLNIPIKTITSIEALASSIDTNNKIITIEDTKGKYVGIFKDNKLIKELIYLKNEDYNNYTKEYINYKEYKSAAFDLEKIYAYCKELKILNPHSVNPIYIKPIEALNGR